MFKDGKAFKMWGDHDTHLDHDLSDIAGNIPDMCIEASTDESHVVPQFQYGPCQIIAKGMDYDSGDGTRFTVLRHIPKHDWVPIFQSDNWMRVIDFCEPICTEFFNLFINSRVYHYDASEWGITGSAWVYAGGLTIEIDTQKPGYYLCINRDDWQDDKIDALERILFTYGCMEQMCGEMATSAEENEVRYQTNHQIKAKRKWRVEDPQGVYETVIVYSEDPSETQFDALWAAAGKMMGCDPSTDVDAKTVAELVRSLVITERAIHIQLSEVQKNLGE